MNPARRDGGQSRKPLIGVLCCNEIANRPVQVVATRFIEPLAHLSNVTVLLVPALVSTVDAREIAHRIDGLLLTGSQSNVAPHHYGAAAEPTHADEERDAVAFALADSLLCRGKPVFGICRGLQEINVLFGGTLADLSGAWHQAPRHAELEFAQLFDHQHEVELAAGGALADGGPARRIQVNSVHLQGIDRLGSGLSIEAVATDDGLVEAVSASGIGAELLAVQWHPEWNIDRCATSRGFFHRIGDALRASAEAAGR